MEFERELIELEQKLEELNRLDVAEHPDLAAEVKDLKRDVERLHHETYTSLTPWQRVQIARHPERPKTQDYLEACFDDVFELRGDRLYSDDRAILTALATLSGRKVVLMGHNKGRTAKENAARNSGSPHPEGYRKAMRAMQLADRFALPIVTMLDTAGAYPGVEAEERGQAWAIAQCLAELSKVRVPVVVVGIGEGGSGGALAIGFGDRLIMLENAYYSVASPEGCASIVYKDAGRAQDAADCLGLTSDSLVELGIADEVIAEPLGGAHHDPAHMYEAVRERIGTALDALVRTDPNELRENRYERLRAYGVTSEDDASAGDTADEGGAPAQSAADEGALDAARAGDAPAIDG
jgi:acetyl-CoA carboxylase carboxyl transferase subunit alpha